MDKIVHFEIPFDNKERAQKFYSETFGWQIKDMPEMKYVMCNTVECDDNNMPKESGAINGGMYNRTDGGSRNPVLVINVENIDEATKKVMNSGGQVTMKKRQVGDMGLYLQFKDTEGNVLGLWQNLKQ